MKKTIGTLLFCVALNAHASFKQDINLCLTVNGDSSPLSFEGRFYSSDLFDSGTYINRISTGKQCAHHLYKHGPKSITLSVRSNLANDDVLLIPNASCNYVKNNNGVPGWLISSYQKTSTPSVTWSLILTQGAPVGMYKYVYYMDCERFAEPT